MNQTFNIGTIARCNRCNGKHPLPKVCEAILESQNATRKVYRLTTMATLNCGHMDSHWIYSDDQR